MTNDYFLSLRVLLLLSSTFLFGCSESIAIIERQLTSGKGEDQAPSWSPDGEFIAFHSKRNGTYDIWIARLKGSQPIHITSESVDEMHPSWSPDSNKLAYIRYYGVVGNTTKGEIYIINRDGTNKLQLTNDKTNILHLVWSHNGDNIIYSETRGTGISFETYVWMLNIKTKSKTKLVDGYKERGPKDNDVFVAGLSIDSQDKNLVFDAVTDVDGSLKRWIFVMKLNINFMKSIVFDMDRAWFPEFSPDDQRIVFHAGKRGSKGLWIVNTDDRKKTRLTKSGRHPSWSPDGKHIAYVKGYGDDAHIWIIDLEDK